MTTESATSAKRSHLWTGRKEPLLPYNTTGSKLISITEMIARLPDGDFYSDWEGVVTEAFKQGKLIGIAIEGEKAYKLPPIFWETSSYSSFSVGAFNAFLNGVVKNDVDRNRIANLETIKGWPVVVEESGFQSWLREVQSAHPSISTFASSSQWLESEGCIVSEQLKDNAANRAPKAQTEHNALPYITAGQAVSWIAFSDFDKINRNRTLTPEESEKLTLANSNFLRKAQDGSINIYGINSTHTGSQTAKVIVPRGQITTLTSIGNYLSYRGVLWTNLEVEKSKVLELWPNSFPSAIQVATKQEQSFQQAQVSRLSRRPNDEELRDYARGIYNEAPVGKKPNTAKAEAAMRKIIDAKFDTSAGKNLKTSECRIREILREDEFSNQRNKAGSSIKS